jgi:hypothetical protein
LGSRHSGHERATASSLRSTAAIRGNARQYRATNPNSRTPPPGTDTGRRAQGAAHQARSQATEAFSRPLDISIQRSNLNLHSGRQEWPEKRQDNAIGGRMVDSPPQFEGITE